VQCLQRKPSQLPSDKYPGTRTRYDDYQAVHIAMTTQIHFVGQFLPWHRRFLALYEADLKGLCGYRGAQPYWGT
jgi:tyrosinase